jgi:hypothetical protein
VAILLEIVVPRKLGPLELNERRAHQTAIGEKGLELSDIGVGAIHPDNVDGLLAARHREQDQLFFIMPRQGGARHETSAC